MSRLSIATDGHRGCTNVQLSIATMGYRCVTDVIISAWREIIHFTLQLTTKKEFDLER